MKEKTTLERWLVLAGILKEEVDSPPGAIFQDEFDEQFGEEKQEEQEDKPDEDK